MKRFVVVSLFLTFFALNQQILYAQETVALKMYSVDSVLGRVVQSYQSESMDLFKTTVYSNSPGASEIIAKAEKAFEQYDTITLALQSYSTVFFKKFGYPRVDIKVRENFRGINVKNNTVYETVSHSAIQFFIDDDGSYLLLYWKSAPEPKTILIKKED